MKMRGVRGFTPGLDRLTRGGPPPILLVHRHGRHGEFADRPA